MKFKHGTRRKANEYEKDLVSYWGKNRTFEKSVEQRPTSNSYVFYDGPPFLTGKPHHGHLLGSAVKDTVARYWTMRGKRVERDWGWDCHGLPAEVYTEKLLGIKDKSEIGTKISLEEYITTCQANMIKTGNEWEDTIDRIGRWVDMGDAYKTMDKEFMESVWWAFKQLHEKGKIYEGEKVLLYCTRDATPISKAEVAMDNSYEEDTDPSVYVKFKLVEGDASLLVWTTTPWTLPSNSAIAVNKDLDYVEVEVAGDRLILAKDLTEAALRDEKNKPVEFTLLRELKGSELVGKAYEPLFEPEAELADNKNAFKIWDASFVHADEGTGIAHESPAYGEDDYELARKNNIPWVMSTDENGIFTMGEWAGEYVWDVNKTIAKELKARGDIWRVNYIQHQYPHCHRCATKLMYRAHPSWFMDIDSQRTEMLEQNGQVNWFPGHIKHGRSEKTIQSAPDWNLSRDRFWATPMPIWKGTDKNGETVVKVIGSYKEIEELSGVVLEDYHMPWIDDVTFTIDGVEFTRIDKVMDCWFESGSMPFAQFHYPFENVDKFERSYPADFITEYVGQVRAWFYYMSAVNIPLFGKNPFKNVIVTGTIAGNDGRKMSKSFGNYTDPNELMDKYSADALRFLFLSSTLLNGEDYALMDENVADVSRKLAMVWNMYDFFTMYAEVDGWEWGGTLDDPSRELSNDLDEWIVSRVHQLAREVEEHMEKYDLPNATKPILPFIDDASNWYVRRSRKRFWKSEDDADKQDAYRTLHYVLTMLAHIMAPFTPFLSEELYHKLTGGESVHLNDWPETGHVNEMLIDEMKHAREIVTVGLSIRAQNQIKVRQPLARAMVKDSVKLSDNTVEIIREELNVRAVNFVAADTIKPDKDGNPRIVDLYLDIDEDLEREGIMREVVRHVQAARKQSGLNVDDRIALGLYSEDSKIMSSINQHKDTIAAETLASEIVEKTDYTYTYDVKVTSNNLTISLEKA